ncbi:TPR repeat-containing protein YrrB [Ruminiclostridium hungatei]|uniref:TPR repeat-containing protein YrrB n=1 Tax=Ruminiclostridium hungatei TaxID=48256 RepID=A0A1V4SFI1_RUMHU|nr:tetratricopeptide repeat protein [Ruminiclostridium hungatei]OPX42027.1 TPR repeat-containing protein YrrB [Ruminiclostridium hungatei]
MLDTSNVSNLLGSSRLAFLNQENETALNLAKQAIKLEPNNPDAYKCAGNAYMSLERYDEAVKNYSQAVKCDSNNGNRYYDLGFALATAEKLADALKNLAKADELGCIPENLVQLYNLLGIVCFDIGRYDDSLVNLSKAEQLIGVDMDILQRKAIVYGIKDDIRNGLLTANQIKLIAPSEYIGYKIAFKLLVQSKRLDAAQKELEKAQKYTAPTMDFYFDCMAFELEKYQTDKNKEHFSAALGIIEKALKTVKPTVNGVIESYINAAEIYLQLENSARTIDCLNAAQNPVGAYNNGFDIVEDSLEPATLTEYDIEDMIEADKQKIADQFGDYGFEEIVESIEPDEEGNRDYLTEIEDGPQDNISVHKLDESDKIEYSPDNIDQINRLYVGTYTIKKDFEKVIEYARKLQASENLHNTYIGKYTEANAMKELGSPDSAAKYEEVIKFFRNTMIKDPTDIMAVTFRIQCYIDIGSYDEAEQICSLLTKEIKEPLLEKIKEAKTGGD